MLNRVAELSAEVAYGGENNSEGKHFSVLELMYKSAINLNKKSTDAFEFGIGFRLGGVCMLLLWAAFECVNNIVKGRQPWMVFPFITLVYI
jgi:hypothetical protein